ncbi:hypothetical protein AVEN_117258-1 [Araneus ventricosus]|uniref:Uncharacterized protein n=1 Tax=Araneus ventricosus TaxID=182803 RepID=A0A4Y2AXE0_ARAVE|nr:hypothetical protein AVEN_117258-1 [Araneus ventricosus]
MEDVQQALVRTSRKSIRKADSELSMPLLTIHNLLHRKLRLYAYKLQIVQKLQPNDGQRRVAFAVSILSRIEIEHDFLNLITFSDEVTFYVSNKVNKHNCKIWSSENPHAVHEVERNSPKINVWCALSHDTVIDTVFFAETSVAANIYLHKLQIYAKKYPKGSICNPLLSYDKMEPLRIGFEHFWIQLSLTDG